MISAQSQPREESGSKFSQDEEPGTWAENLRRKMERGEKAREDEEKEV